MATDGNQTKYWDETYPETYPDHDQQMVIPTYQETQVEDQWTVTVQEQDEKAQYHGPETHTNQDMEEHRQLYEDHIGKSEQDLKDHTEDALHHQHIINQKEHPPDQLSHTL